jgi:hypothetical protein
MANGGLCCVAVRLLLLLYHTADHMRMCVFGLMFVFCCESNLVLRQQSAAACWGATARCFAHLHAVFMKSGAAGAEDCAVCEGVLVSPRES